MHTSRPITKLPRFNYKQLELSFRSRCERASAQYHIKHTFACDEDGDGGGGGGGDDAINKTAAFELDKIYAVSGGSTRALFIISQGLRLCLFMCARFLYEAAVDFSGARDELFVFLIDGWIRRSQSREVGRLYLRGRLKFKLV